MNGLKLAATASLLACASAVNATDGVGIFFGGNVGYSNLSEDKSAVSALTSQQGFAGSVKC